MLRGTLIFKAVSKRGERIYQETDGELQEFKGQYESAKIHLSKIRGIYTALKIRQREHFKNPIICSAFSAVMRVIYSSFITIL